MSVIAYLAQLAKPLGAFFVGLVGGLLIRKNQELTQEAKDRQKIIVIQSKIIDAKKESKNTTADDVINIMLQDKF